MKIGPLPACIASVPLSGKRKGRPGGNDMAYPTRRATLAGATAIAAAILISAPAGAQTSLKWAHVYETSEPYHVWAVWAADEFAKRTEGRYAIEVFPASSLGKESDINEGLALGTVDIIYTGQLFAGRSYGPIAIGGAPYMFRDYAHWDKFRSSDLFKELSEGYLEASGNHVVAMTYYGERHVTSNKEIQKPEDMAGLKIRVPDAPLYMMFPRAVGANPTPIAFAEVYLALQQGVVDAQENPLPTIEAKKFFEVQKYIVLTGHITDALLTIIGGPAWDKVEEADRNILIEILNEAAGKATAEIVEKEKALVQGFRDMGKEVVEVDKAPFREAVVKAHMGPDATWDQGQYDRLQAIQ
jgi:tripartite ATP-independent transporter DctP family solute receptor